jgi:hypothetical protein
MKELHNPRLFRDQSHYVRQSRLDQSQLLDIDRQLENWLDREPERLERTHYFHGRHENLYLRDAPPPALRLLIDEATGLAAELLDMPVQELRAGWWFNRMMPGDVTTLHTHDDGFELLSGVVYLRVPEGSGELVLETGGEQIHVTPAPGAYRFFDPTTPHRVTRNASGERRLSIGMNFGPADSPW